MFSRIRVLGLGRAGSTIAARLRERGLLSEADDADLVLLCVPDRSIAEVARTQAPGPWIAHISGATSIAALAPHTLRFTMHPLQTLVRTRGPEQLDGAWAAVCGETDAATSRGIWLSQQLGLRPFELADQHRAVYHAGAALASNYLVTLHHAAARALDAAGAPPDALLPLMRRTIDNDFELTGPIARGDWATVDAHLDALRATLPDLEPLYRALADATPR